MGSEAIGEKIIHLHNQLRQSWPNLTRLAVAIYEGETGLLKTFASSTDQVSPLLHYSVKLNEVPSLAVLAESGKSRILQQLGELTDSSSLHARWLRESGFRSSYTVPLFGYEALIGFLFFDATEEHYFTPTIVATLTVYSELIGAILINELAPIQVLRGALYTAHHLTHHRDAETAAHLFRMSHYAQLIAIHLADSRPISDEYIEFILQYAPLHDIGKIGISDTILLKPGRLSAEEFVQAKLHVNKGLDIIDTIVNEFNLRHLSHIDILRNLIGTHHEHYDGRGYPHGLSGKAIPLEGRIVAVADVLDALTSPRPYKPAWSFGDAVAYISKHAGSHFDPDCVAALLDHRGEFEAIYDRFTDGQGEGEQPL